jgi:hypothetical protein
MCWLLLICFPFTWLVFYFTLLTQSMGHMWIYMIHGNKWRILMTGWALFLLSIQDSKSLIWPIKKLEPKSTSVWLYTSTGSLTQIFRPCPLPFPHPQKSSGNTEWYGEGGMSWEWEIGLDRDAGPLLWRAFKVMPRSLNLILQAFGGHWPNSRVGIREIRSWKTNYKATAKD